MSVIGVVTHWDFKQNFLTLPELTVTLHWVLVNISCIPRLPILTHGHVCEQAETFLAPFNLPSTLTSFLVPTEQKHRHNIMLPAPCFTVWINVLKRIGSLVWFLPNIALWQSQSFKSKSDHKTFSTCLQSLQYAFLAYSKCDFIWLTSFYTTFYWCNWLLVYSQNMTLLTMHNFWQDLQQFERLHLLGIVSYFTSCDAQETYHPIYMTFTWTTNSGQNHTFWLTTSVCILYAWSLLFSNFGYVALNFLRIWCGKYSNQCQTVEGGGASTGSSVLPCKMNVMRNKMTVVFGFN